MNLEIHESLNKDLTTKIENFLLQNNSTFNPLFSSPVWAKRLKELLNFDYEYLIVKESDEIIALHLIFKGYRGYAKINNLPVVLKGFAKQYAKLFYGYINWYNFIIFKDDLQDTKKEDSKKLIYETITQKNTKIQNSPIYSEDEKFFDTTKVSNWGTYIIDLENKTYEEVYASFKRQAKRPIKNAKEQGIYVEKLKLDNIEQYANWLIENQQETGKAYKVDVNIMKKEFNTFNKENYTYEIFVAYKDNMILGSLGIWGYRNYVSEFGSYQSRYAKENKLYAQDIIKDKIIQYAIENNIWFYDLAGFNPSPESSKKENAIRNFKEKFQGREFIYKTIES